MTISIVIPIYNEREIIEKTLEEIKKISIDNYNLEFIFSNDGSTDGCEKLVLDACRNDKRIKYVAGKINMGKGSAIRKGILASTGDYVAYTDCDLAYGIEQIQGIIKENISSGYDITIGSRSLHKNGYQGYSFSRKLISKVYLKLLFVYSGFKYSDSQTGLKCFKGNVARNIFSHCIINRFAFDLEALLYAEKLGYTIKEFPVYVLYSDKKLGRTSKIHFIKDSLNMIGDIRRIKRNKKRIMK